LGEKFRAFLSCAKRRYECAYLKIYTCMKQVRRAVGVPWDGEGMPLSAIARQGILADWIKY